MTTTITCQEFCTEVAAALLSSVGPKQFQDKVKELLNLVDFGNHEVEDPLLYRQLFRASEETAILQQRIDELAEELQP